MKLIGKNILLNLQNIIYKNTNFKIFKEEYLHKYEKYFEEDNTSANLIIDKILENVKEFNRVNKKEFSNISEKYFTESSNNYFCEETIANKSKYYLIFGNFLINMFTKYNCYKAFKYFLEKRKLFPLCFEAWENFFLFAERDLIIILAKKNTSLFCNFFPKIIKKICEEEIETNFLSYIIYCERFLQNYNYDYYDVMYNCCNNEINKFNNVFSGFINKIWWLNNYYEEKFFTYVYLIITEGFGTFYQHQEFLNHVMEYDLDMKLLKIVKNNDKNNVNEFLLSRIMEAINFNKVNKNITYYERNYGYGFLDHKMSDEGHNCGIIKELSIKPNFSTLNK